MITMEELAKMEWQLLIKVIEDWNLKSGSSLINSFVTITN